MQGADITRLAKKMLRKPKYRVAHAFVRTDLFLNRRKERNKGLRKDAADDVYHLVNASYCHIYGTSDKDQLNYAQISIPGVEIAFYDRVKSVGDWLCSLSDN